MGQKLPQANTRFQQKQSTLAQFAARVYNMMTGNSYYPTPAIPLATLVGYINTYNAMLASSVKGSKTDTASKNAAKGTLVNALRVQAKYVTQTAYNLIATSSIMEQQLQAMRTIILSSGFEISKVPNPVADTGGLDLAIIKKVISDQPGNIHILLRQYATPKRGTKTWQIQYRTALEPGTVPVPAGPWQTNTYTSGNIYIDGLTSGKTYDYQIAAVGGNNTKLNQRNQVNFSVIKQVVVI